MNRSISIEAFNDIERFKQELSWVKDAGFRTVDIGFWRNVCLKEDREDYAKAIIDYISGMTDRYAITKIQDLMIPASWGY